MLWKRIGFNADPDLAFHLNANRDPNPGPKQMRSHGNPDQDYGHKELNFYMTNIFYVGTEIGHKPYLPVRRYKSHFETLEIRYIFTCYFGQFSCSWTRIRIPNTGPDPDELNQCGSMRRRIHNTFS